MNQSTTNKKIGTKVLETSKRISRHENIVLGYVLIALIGIFGAISKGLTLGYENAINILLQSSIRGIVAVGQAFVILTAGIDLSVAGVGLLCSTIGASLMTSNPELSIVAHPYSIYSAIPIMVLMGTGLGAANGLAVSRLGLPALIVTLAIWRITEGASFAVAEGDAIGDLPQTFSLWGGEVSVGVIPIPVIIFVVVCVVAYIVLQYTRFGRAIYAVGGSPTSSWLSGINVKMIQFSVYTISGFLAGLGSVIYTARFMSASMWTMVRYELETIAAVVIGGVSLMGGRGNIIGVALGVFIIGVIYNGMFVLGEGRAEINILTGAIMFIAVAIDVIRRR